MKDEIYRGFQTRISSFYHQAWDHEHVTRSHGSGIGYRIPEETQPDHYMCLYMLYNDWAPKVGIA